MQKIKLLEEKLNDSYIVRVGTNKILMDKFKSTSKINVESLYILM